MESQRKGVDFRTVLSIFFIFVWMTGDNIATNAEIVNSTGVWKNAKGMLLKFEEMSDDNISAALFIKSKGFFNLTGMKAQTKENGTFYLNTVQSKYAIGIAGQFLLCEQGMEQLYIALLFGANKDCDSDIFNRNSVHAFFRVEESMWFDLKFECLEEDSTEDDESAEEINDDSSEDENCTLAGFWMNQFNSTVNLTVDETGKISGLYDTKHERANGTSGDGLATIDGWKGQNSMFTFSMVWNGGTSVTTLLGLQLRDDNGRCILWIDFALIIAQHSCTNAWQFCIISSYNKWAKLE